MEDPVRIALVDDHRLFRSGIASLIEDFDRYTILFEAGDGEEMIRKINPKNKPHIILLDISMPKMNGIECLKNIKGLAHLNHCKIFMYSTTSEASVLEKSKKLGATDFIVKPASPAVLKETLSGILNN